MGLATSSKEEESSLSSGESLSLSSLYLEARSLMLAVWVVIEGGGPFDSAEGVGAGSGAGSGSAAFFVGGGTGVGFGEGGL